MTESDVPLTPVQQQLMAYVDDELSALERAEFERQLAEDPDLAAEVADFQCLADMTSSMTLAEPTDHEMRRFWENFYNRSEWQIGWIFLICGLTVLAAYGLLMLLSSELHWVIKAGSLSALAGAGILFFNTLRLRMRTLRFDRYRGVMR